MSRLVLIGMLAWSGSASGQQGSLEGSVRDAWSGTPAVGVIVVSARGGETATTDEAGRFRLSLPPGEHTLFVEGPRWRPARWVRRRVVAGHTSTGSLALLPASGWPTTPPLAGAVGLPPPRGEVGFEGQAQRLARLPAGALLAQQFDGLLPASLRVGRRENAEGEPVGSCRDGEVVRVEAIELEDYVKGVVRAEVGVFGGIEGGADAAMASWSAMAVAARSYALWFYLRDPDKEWHLDDTACNQVYRDARDPGVDRAVEATRGVVLVKSEDRVSVDKFEYAASCGRHGSLPEYADSTVPDETGEEACVGSWCGHNGCAAHEVNQDFPDAGRCLVRGICQWGSAERSMRGDGWQEILAHYQPHLALLGAGAVPDPEQTGSLVGFVRAGSAVDGLGLAGARVFTSEGDEAISREDGLYRLTGLTAGLTILGVALEGYISQSVEVEVFGGEPHWQSFALQPVAGAGDQGADADVGPGPDSGPSSGAWDAASRGDPRPPGSGGGVQGEPRSGSVGCVLGGSGAQPWRWLRRWR